MAASFYERDNCHGETTSWVGEKDVGETIVNPVLQVPAVQC